MPSGGGARKLDGMWQNRWVRIAVCALAVAGVWWFFFRPPDDVRAIRQRLERFAELVEKDGAESTLRSVGTARKLAAFFVEGAEIRYLPRRAPVRAGEGLEAAFVNLRGRLGAIDVRLRKHDVTVAGDGRRADSRVRVTASVADGAGDRRTETHDYRILWRKEAGDWRMRDVAHRSGPGG